MKFNDMGYTRMEMSLNTYQHLTARTDDTTKSLEWRKSSYGLGIAGEAGEVADLIKKEIYHEHEIDPQDVKKELGDVLWYAARVAALYGFTLEEIATANVEKLMRRYQKGFSSAASKKRVDTKEEKEIVTDLADNAYEFSKRIEELKVNVPNKQIRMSKAVVEEALAQDDSQYPKYIQLMRQATRDNLPEGFTGIEVERSVRKPGYYEQVNVIYCNETPVTRITVRVLEDGAEHVEVVQLGLNPGIAIVDEMSAWKTEIRSCPVCIGTGNDHMGHTCSMCSGTGHVTV